MQIAVLLFERMTALDAIGPIDVLSRLPGAEMVLAGPVAGTIRTEVGIGLVADSAYRDVTHPDILLVPGGVGQADLMGDEALLDWIRDCHEHSTWTTSVCTGSLLLGAAGVLRGKKATSHWLALEQLRAWGAEPVHERVVEDGKVITAAGVSAGIDMGLLLAARLAGDEVAQTIQLGIEYDPQPPFDAGSPLTAPDFAVDFLRSQSRFVLEGR